MMHNNDGITVNIWPAFVDLYSVLFLSILALFAFLLTPGMSASNTGSHPENTSMPPHRLDLFIIITDDGHCIARCNDTQITPNELRVKTQAALVETKTVNVAASIDEDVPFGFINDYEKAVINLKGVRWTQEKTLHGRKKK